MITEGEYLSEGIITPISKRLTNRLRHSFLDNYNARNKTNLSIKTVEHIMYRRRKLTVTDSGSYVDFFKELHEYATKLDSVHEQYFN